MRVGMATNIPPHNLGETIDAVKLVMDNPDVTTREIMKSYLGQVSTGALVMGKSGIHRAYETGKGSVFLLRSRTEIEEYGNGRERIVVRFT